MNTFMKLRENMIKDSNPDNFTVEYLKEYEAVYKAHNPRESFLFESVTRIKNLSIMINISNDEIIEAIWNLGKNEYLDRMITDLVLKHKDQMDDKDFEKTMSFVLANKTNDQAIVYNVLDLAIELNLPLIEEQAVLFLMDQHQKHMDVISILIDYCHNFWLEELLNIFINMLDQSYPDNIKMQIISMIKDANHELDMDLMNKINANPVYGDYAKLLEGQEFDEQGGLTLVQSMFQGDFDEDGKGNNGGVAVLLKHLGNALSKDDHVGMVLSISINNQWSGEKELIHTYSSRHKLIRMPIYMDKHSRDPYVKKERFIVRFIDRLFSKAQIEPDVFHVRYLDNASRSMAILCERLKKKLVFTLTPDPHRSMFKKSGQLEGFEDDAYLSKLNKIRIGDELILRSDGILGIGNEPVKAELKRYFPQLNMKDIGRKLNMIDEAIVASKDLLKENGLHFEESDFVGIPKVFINEPVILNVGRLNHLKGQDQLAQAWGNSELSSTHRLLIIGGDLLDPSIEEAQIMDSFATFFSQNPQLRSRFLHIPAMPNHEIRRLEETIMKAKHPSPNIYFCSSKKEEFGIAILEAMAEGMLVMAPENGGPKSYINHGKNGFLVDTTNWLNMAKDLCQIMYQSDISQDQFRDIRLRGQKTVLETFNMDRVSREMLDFYLGLKGVAA